MAVFTNFTSDEELDTHTPETAGGVCEQAYDIPPGQSIGGGWCDRHRTGGELQTRGYDRGTCKGMSWLHKLKLGMAFSN